MRKILRLLPKPSHFAAAEWGVPRKDAPTVRVRAALAFPDLYEVGMSYLGQKILSESVNRRPGLFAERVFALPAEAAEVLAAHGERLCTLETDTPLCTANACAPWRPTPPCATWTCWPFTSPTSSATPTCWP